MITKLFTDPSHFTDFMAAVSAFDGLTGPAGALRGPPGTRRSRRRREETGGAGGGVGVGEEEGEGEDKGEVQQEEE